MKDVVVYNQWRCIEFGLKATVSLSSDIARCYRNVTSCWHLSRDFTTLPNSGTNNIRRMAGLTDGIFLYYLQSFVACDVEW